MIPPTSTHENFTPELFDVARLFAIATDDMHIVHTHEDGAFWKDSFLVFACGKRVSMSKATPARGEGALEQKRLRKRQCKNTLYAALKQATGYKPPWGSLTGIRPTRLLYEAMTHEPDMQKAQASLVQNFDLRPDKAALLGQCVQMQTGLMDIDPLEYDVYVGIPFCPTRCTYCSFAATDLKTGGKLVEEYVDALLREMALCAADMKAMGRKLRCLYVGGGTPTALTASQLERVLSAATTLFGTSREFTVEAGRPDSLDKEKLAVIKQAGAGRISINPQSMNDATLAAIGRLHGADAIVSAFEMAREVGFDCINSDLIAALPGEGPKELEETLRRLEPLAPENITVHTLAIKRSSKLRLEGYQQADAKSEAKRS